VGASITPRGRRSAQCSLRQQASRGPLANDANKWVALAFEQTRWPTQVNGGRNALLGSIPSTNRRDSTALALELSAVATTPYGCPMFAPAYVGRKRWATRISYFALLATTTCAALRRESRMQIIKATGLDRKSGGAQWRDLRFLSPAQN
jgi:hypothetical protein